MPQYPPFDPGTILRFADALKQFRPPADPETPLESPGLAALARAAGRGGVEQTGTPRTFTGSGTLQVEGDPSGKYWLDPQTGKWRVAGELPPGYVIKPPVKR